MRKVDNSTSQDGADTTSITSTFENESKKSSTGLKTKRNSVKRKIPNFSHDSDDTAIEPLLQSDKEKSDKNRSAKFSMSKSKSDLTNETPNIVTESHLDHVIKTSSSHLSENIPYINSVKDISVVNTSVTAPIYNYMNTNIFGGPDTTKPIQTKSAVIVELDNTKSSSYNPSPMIFTTAKIHADNKAKQLEPLHITPVPILSTIEGNIIKSKPSTSSDTEKRYGCTNFKSDIQKQKSQENDDKFIKTSNFNDKENTKSLSITTDSKNKSTNICKENTSTILSPVQSTSKASFENSLKRTDVNISGKSNPKVDLNLSTVGKSGKTLHHEIPHSLTADNAKVNITAKAVTDSAQFDPQKTINNLSKVEKILPVDDNKKQVSEDISFHKPFLNSNKESIETNKTCADSVNKEKPTKMFTNVPSNRQLQRQKNATVDDISDVDIKNKNIDSNKSQSSNSNLIANQSTTTNMPTKDTTHKEFDNKMKSIVDKPKVSVQKDNVTTKLIKPVNSVPISRIDKTGLVTEVPIQKPKTVVTSANSTVPETKTIISSKESKSNIVPAGSAISNQKNTTYGKETAKTISEQSAVVGGPPLSDNVGPLKNIRSSSSIKPGSSSTSKPEVSNNTVLPSTASKADSSENKVPSTTGSSTTISKDAITSSLPSNSAKSMIATNKNIEPILSKHNKDSRA